MPAWKAVWPAFGASNQLLAALALLVVFAWLHRQGKRAWYVAIPTVFMCVTTLTALAQLVQLNLLGGGSLFLGVLSLVLMALALAVIVNVGVLLARKAPASPQGRGLPA
jgi:carbon starvation protein